MTRWSTVLLGAVLLVLALRWTTAQSQSVTCDVVHDPVDARRWALGGPACPVVGSLVIYRAAATNGDGGPIVPTQLMLAGGAPGTTVGLFWPVQP